ncbi:hypothetical protein GIB67_013534 [Kingdonia uniflora]|uniref:DUF4283 domain-containing protein n=1 Tax=Kingdonia uniflora TaxID=39325 RepID=A0A7J7KUX9_9MAGN|nr:hypothetical protein GIB67_013534 [Kingdonia uniflora]
MNLLELESSFVRAPIGSNPGINGVSSYAEMAKENTGRSCSLEQLPIPGRRGDFPSIKVTIEAHKRGLGVEFWEVETLMFLGRTLGTPIQIDQSASTMEFGYFAKVLIDIDLAVPIPNKILVEVVDGNFWQRVELGSTPKFCSHCKIIGHYFVECRAIKEQVLRAEEPKEKQKNVENPVPETVLTKNQRKRIRKKKHREEMSIGKETLEELVAAKEATAEAFDKMSQQTFEASTSNQELAGNEDTQSHLRSIQALTIFEQSTPKHNNKDLANSPSNDPRNSHQLLKETAIIRLQSALKWADMVEDTERDEALIAHEGAWETPGKHQKNRQKNMAKKKATGFSIGNNLSRLTLRRVVRQSQPKFIFIAEPQIKSTLSNILKLGLSDFSHSFISNDCELGNLWCLWQNGLQDPVLVTGSPQQITIIHEGILISAIHGKVTISSRRALWADMIIIAALNLPWLAIGDFNCIRNWDERSGGTGPNSLGVTVKTEKLEFCVDSIERSTTMLGFKSLKVGSACTQLELTLIIRPWLAVPKNFPNQITSHSDFLKAGFLLQTSTILLINLGAKGCLEILYL